MYFVRCSDGFLEPIGEDLNDAINDVHVLDEFDDGCGPHVVINDENEVIYRSAEIK